jgi:hypothetical protein
MRVVQHKVGGKHYGCFYELPDGRYIYLAHRRYSQVYRKRIAWCLDCSTLNRAGDYAAVAIGVAVKEGKKTYYYLTRPEDFWGAHSFINPDNPAQRGLPLNRFTITPAHDPAYIATKMRLR